jgi:hypothetical protein
VAGVVEGYGRYRGGNLGFRCAKARIAALCVLPLAGKEHGWREWAEEALGQAYGVPVYSTVETMLRAHPPSRGKFAARERERREVQAVSHPAGPPAPAVQVQACVTCGEPPAVPGSALCTGCEVLANLAARQMTLVRCPCGAAHAVTAQRATVSLRCQCGATHEVPPPAITPAQALRQLQDRSRGWRFTLRSRRLQVWEQCKALADGAASENRAFTPVEQAAWDYLSDKLDELDVLILATLRYDTL